MTNQKCDGAEYFARRAEQERRAAGLATNPRAKETHLELATRYEEAAAGRGLAANDERPDQRGPSTFPGLTLI